jgi:hypothetical protein
MVVHMEILTAYVKLRACVLDRNRLLWWDTVRPAATRRSRPAARPRHETKREDGNALHTIRSQIDRIIIIISYSSISLDREPSRQDGVFPNAGPTTRRHEICARRGTHGRRVATGLWGGEVACSLSSFAGLPRLGLLAIGIPPASHRPEFSLLFICISLLAPQFR